MSEYQYYEFQAVDRPLTAKQMSELRRISSRAEITPHRFVNVYNFGDFKGDPEKLVAMYYDAFLYLANWGTRWLLLRVPKKLLAPEVVATYNAGHCLSFRAQRDNLILSFRSEDEEDYEWAEGAGWLGSIVPIRTELMRGDLRALYLGWLLAAQVEEVDEDALEPPVPPGLGDLDVPLVRLAEFLRIDTDLITAAAERSTARQDASLSKKELDRWISKLPAKEKNALLAKLITSDDPHLVTEIRQRAIGEVRGAPPRPTAPQRTAAELLERASVLGEARRKREAAQRAREKARRDRIAAAKRKKHLESLVGQEDRLWAEVDELIGTRQPKSYDEAVSLLRDLRDLTQTQGAPEAFAERMTALCDEHRRKKTLLERFEKAKLVD
jgi:hypothetical protein